MTTGTPAFPEALATELTFPDLALPQTEIPQERAETLSQQAFVLEFAANSIVCAYSSRAMRTDLWVAHLAPELVEFHQGLIPERYSAVAETRTMIAPEFQHRVTSGLVSTIDQADILSGLLAFEDQPAAEMLEATMAACDEADDLSEIPGFLSAGNNAAAFLLPDSDKHEAILKVGFPIYDAESCCDQSAATNLYRWLGLMAGNGVEGFEQPVAFSAEQPITITRRAPGMELAEISELTNKPQPTEAALQRFADAFYESIVRRIVIDVSGRDILYAPDTDELTIIDHGVFSRGYTAIASSYYRDLIDALTRTFEQSFGYEFDARGFNTLLEEFGKQGYYDLVAQIKT